MKPRRAAILALLAVTQLMGVLDFSIVNLALPSIERQFDLTPDQLQWVVSAYALTLGGFLLTEVRPESPSGSLALMQPISRVAFCAPRCAYVEYAHSGARRLLGSGPPEPQISRPGFRPHL